MNAELRFLEPLDVLFLRGNKLFGDPGSYGEALVPPWPSVVAGAIRSRLLADAKADLHNPATWPKELGTPDSPGSFTVTAFHLARRHSDGYIEPIYPLPADLMVSEDEDGKPSLRALKPFRPLKLISSSPLPWLPVLAETKRGKPATGYWLSEAGWRKYLKGKLPDAADLVKTEELWRLDFRVGVGLDAELLRAEEGKLFSMQAVAMQPGVGFLVAVAGAAVPRKGTLRLGGDGRGAAIYDCQATLPEPDYEAIARTRRCRLILTTPGLFQDGWLPTGVMRGKDEYRFDLHGVKGRLVCAAVPRAEVVSGWDLAKWEPKPALHAVPTGSVYWLELDEAVTEDGLRKLVAQGLWTDEQYDADMRRAEGFNHLVVAAWE